MKANIWWAWGQAELRPDPAMTRDRLARAFRAWRNGAAQVQRLGTHDYQVSLNGVSARVQVRA